MRKRKLACAPPETGVDSAVDSAASQRSESAQEVVEEPTVTRASSRRSRNAASTSSSSSTTSNGRETALVAGSGVSTRTRSVCEGDDTTDSGKRGKKTGGCRGRGRSTSSETKRSGSSGRSTRATRRAGLLNDEEGGVDAAEPSISSAVSADNVEASQLPEMNPGTVEDEDDDVEPGFGGFDVSSLQCQLSPVFAALVREAEQELALEFLSEALERRSSTTGAAAWSTPSGGSSRAGSEEHRSDSVTVASDGGCWSGHADDVITAEVVETQKERDGLQLPKETAEQYSLDPDTAKKSAYVGEVPAIRDASSIDGGCVTEAATLDHGEVDIKGIEGDCSSSAVHSEIGISSSPSHLADTSPVASNDEQVSGRLEDAVVNETYHYKIRSSSSPMKPGHLHVQFKCDLEDGSNDRDNHGDGERDVLQTSGPTLSSPSSRDSMGGHWPEGDESGGERGGPGADESHSLSSEPLARPPPPPSLPDDDNACSFPSLPSRTSDSEDGRLNTSDPVSEPMSASVVVDGVSSVPDVSSAMSGERLPKEVVAEDSESSVSSGDDVEPSPVITPSKVSSAEDMEVDMDESSSSSSRSAGGSGGSSAVGDALVDLWPPPPSSGRPLSPGSDSDDRSLSAVGSSDSLNEVPVERDIKVLPSSDYSDEDGPLNVDDVERSHELTDESESKTETLLLAADTERLNTETQETLGIAEKKDCPSTQSKEGVSEEADAEENVIVDAVVTPPVLPSIGASNLQDMEIADCSTEQEVRDHKPRCASPPESSSGSVRPGDFGVCENKTTDVSVISVDRTSSDIKSSQLGIPVVDAGESLRPITTSCEKSVSDDVNEKEDQLVNTSPCPGVTGIQPSVISDTELLPTESSASSIKDSLPFRPQEATIAPVAVSSPVDSFGSDEQASPFMGALVGSDVSPSGEQSPPDSAVDAPVCATAGEAQKTTSAEGDDSSADSPSSIEPIPPVVNIYSNTKRKSLTASPAGPSTGHTGGVDNALSCVESKDGLAMETQSVTSTEAPAVAVEDTSSIPPPPVLTAHPFSAAAASVRYSTQSAQPSPRAERVGLLSDLTNLAVPISTADVTNQVVSSSCGSLSADVKNSSAVPPPRPLLQTIDSTTGLHGVVPGAGGRQQLSRQSSTESSESLRSGAGSTAAARKHFMDSASKAGGRHTVTARDARPAEVIEAENENKLRKFTVVKENIWRKKQKLTKQQKDARRMMCDCYLSREEQMRGDMGCGEDCLNRLLMIECGSRCILADKCSNKRFSRQDYYATSVFKTDLKGFGLRAETDMPASAFIYEYVGEVLDASEFRRRTKEYDRLKYRHHYFMALSSDSIIDATEKGNASRFINHSCDPNSETQKWTVNGELRIGFFTRRPVAAGEELTFDYQLQRYGREAQKCYCGTPLCRGWIGGKRDEQLTDGEDLDDDDEDDAEQTSAVVVEDSKQPLVAEQPAAGGPTVQAQPRVSKKTLLRRAAERRDWENEIKKLMRSGLKSKQHTLELSRLMVRADSDAERRTLLNLIRAADPPCRRLFLDYHGLRLIWSWMTIGPTSGADPSDVHTFRRELLETLSTLPIPNRSMLKDSRVLSMVERWASGAVSAALPPPTPSSTCSSAGGTTPRTPDTDSGSSPSMADATAAAVPSVADLHSAQKVVDLAGKLLDSWSGLQEVFRIPKKERIELMREHEKEADRGYQTYLQQEPRHQQPAGYKKGYNCSPERRGRRSPDHHHHHHHHHYSGGLTGGGGPLGTPSSSRKYRAFSDSRLTKEERRQMFMLEVQREEQESQQREQQEELWRGHEQRCTMLGLDPYLTPIFDPSYQYYWEPSSGSWQPYTPGDPSVPLVPAAGVDPAQIASLPQQLAVYQSMAATDPAQAQLYLEQISRQRQQPYLTCDTAPPPASLMFQSPPAAGASPQQGMGLMELLQSKLPGKFVTDDGREISLLSSLAESCSSSAADGGAVANSTQDSVGNYQLTSYTDPSQPNITIANVPVPDPSPLPPGRVGPLPPPPAPQPLIKLPPKWRVSKDSSGRFYYYHQVTRVTQWEPPAFPDSTTVSDPPLHTVEETLVTRSSTGSSSSSSSNSSSGGVGGQRDRTGASVRVAAPTSRDRHQRDSGTGGSSSSESSTSGGESESSQQSSSDETDSHQQLTAAAVVLPAAAVTAKSRKSGGGDEEDLEEGEIREDMRKDEEFDRKRMVDMRYRRKTGKRRVGLVQERIISPLYDEKSRRKLRHDRRKQKRLAKTERRREKRRERDLERLLLKHRRQLKVQPLSGQTGAGGDGNIEQPPHEESGEEDEEDKAKLEREEAIRRFKAREQALSRAKEQELQRTRQLAAMRKKRKTSSDAADTGGLAATHLPVSRPSSHKKRRVEVARISPPPARHKPSASGDAPLAAAAPDTAASTPEERLVVDVPPELQAPPAAVIAELSTAPASSCSSAAVQQSSAPVSAPSRSKHRSSGSSSGSDGEKKIKERFLAHMSLVIVSALNAFRRSDCKKGRITNTDDFKYLAKKLTHHVMLKELKNVKRVRDLQASDSVKHKAKYYVKKYMGRFGPQFARDGSAVDADDVVADESRHAAADESDLE